MTQKVTVSVDVEVEIPEGYTFVEYREPIKGEMWIDVPYGDMVKKKDDEKRIIIEKLVKVSL